MKKKTRFLAVIIAALTVLSFGACSDVEMKIKQMRCEHEMNEGEITVQATCKDVGEKTLTCTLCGYEETEEVPATGHTWQKVEAVAPTCTKVGKEEGIICVSCHEYFIEGVEIPAIGHSVVIDKGYSPTCKEKGMTDGKHCGVCNEVIIAQEILPVLADHLDVDEDYACDGCMMNMGPTANMVEVALETGMEMLVGNWLRIYKPSAVKEHTYNPNNDYPFTYRNVITMVFNGEDSFLNNVITVMDNGIFYSGQFVKIEGMTVIETMDYIDFHFELGTYKVINAESGEFVDTTCVKEDLQLDEWGNFPGVFLLK